MSPPVASALALVFRGLAVLTQNSPLLLVLKALGHNKSPRKFRDIRKSGLIFMLGFGLPGPIDRRVYDQKHKPSS